MQSHPLRRPSSETSGCSRSNGRPPRQPCVAGRASASPAVVRGGLVAAVLAATALVASASPAMSAWMEYDRAAVSAGQLWRLLTCHLAHFTPTHLGYDLFAFVVLTALSLGRAPRRAAIAITSAAALIPLASWVLLPNLQIYRGLSGLDSALYALFGLLLLREARADRDTTRMLVAGAALAAFATKIGYELLSGAAVFAPSDVFAPVPLAHVVGAGCGLLAFGVPLGRAR